VERCDETTALPGSHNAAVRESAEHLDPRPHLTDYRCPYEDPMKRTAIHTKNIKIGLETVHLPAKRVPLHHKVHDPKERLFVANVACHEHQASTGSPDGQRGVHRAQSVDQAILHGQFSNGSALTPGQDDSSKALQLLGQANLPRLDTETSQRSAVFLEISLQGKNPYDEHTISHGR
jgi:hypothetical protein